MKIPSSIRDVVQNLGLDDYELRLYAAAIETGVASASRLAKRTGIPRTSTYSALERLQQKGLVAMERRSSSQVYLPSPPETLVLRAEEEVARAQASLRQAKEVSEFLQTARGQDAMTSSKVLIFEGRAALRNMLYTWEERWRDAVIASRKPWGGFQDDSFLQHYGEWVVHYWTRFANAKDSALDKVQLFADEGAYSRQVGPKVEGTTRGRRQLRPLKGHTNFTGSFWIVGDYLVLINTRTEPHHALQVRDAALAENVRAVFEKLWSVSKDFE